ncbi:MAG: hypothetical protein M1840_007722 [Geoglossum simile]|nr:MAG: hypothetical protein M1840_007722 [Geoglossum simile]
MTSLQDVEQYRRGGRLDDIRDALSSKNKNYVPDWLSQVGALETPLSKGVNLVRDMTSKGESGLNVLRQAVSDAIESISDRAGEVTDRSIPLSRGTPVSVPISLCWMIKSNALTQMLHQQPNLHEPDSSGNRSDLKATAPPSCLHRLEKRRFTGPNGEPLHILTPMCDRPRSPQYRRPPDTSTGTSTPSDTTSTSRLTTSSRTSIGEVPTPTVPTPTVPISPLSTRRRKIFLPRTTARQQSLHEAENTRKLREAERDERINARGPAHKERLRLVEDSLNLQHLLLLKLAAVENKAALSTPTSENGVPAAVREAELRRQRREHTEALKTSLKFPH